MIGPAGDLRIILAALRTTGPGAVPADEAYELASVAVTRAQERFSDFDAMIPGLFVLIRKWSCNWDLTTVDELLEIGVLALKHASFTRDMWRLIRVQDTKKNHTARRRTNAIQPKRTFNRSRTA